MVKCVHDDDTDAAYSIYNLVLENGQHHNPVIMDEIESIMLGHGIMDDVTLDHDYFGTENIVKDL